MLSLEIHEVYDVLEVYENYSFVGNDNSKCVIYNNENSFKEGNKILFHGQLESINNSYNSFNNYLNKNNIWYELNYYDFEIIDDRVNINVMIVDKLLENKSEESKSYLKLILFNEKDVNNSDFYDTFSLYSLTYLIAVSGFHIHLLLSFFKKIFKSDVIGIGVVCFYLYLLDFTVSSYRAFLCFIFKKINKKLCFDMTSIDIVSLIASVFIIFNPCIMFSYSFIYSFLATFILEILKLYKSKNIPTVFYIYLLNIPLMLLNYYKLNLATVLFGILLSLPVSFLYIFSFIFLFLDKFYLLYELTIKVFYLLFDVLSRFNIIFIFGKPSISFVVIYYLVFISFFICKERKSNFKYVWISLLFALVSYQYYKPVILGKEQIYFLNVGQGDCSVFFIPNSKEVILVDTGGSLYKDVALKEIIPFLESKGINKIKNVVLTHDDFDHIGALESLKNNFKVENVANSSLIEEIEIGNKIFKNLNVSENRDNEGSIVLYGNYAGYDLLLMGDAPVNVEVKIMEKIDNVDIIKIGHHGSNTSSNYEFLSYIGAKFAIISVGENNRYGHPHKDVIERLHVLGYIVLRTDVNNDIGFGKNIFGFRFVDYFD